MWKTAFFLTVVFWPLSLYLNYNPLPAPNIISVDYESRQEVIRNTHLYPNIPLARMFQNKVVLVANKFYNNFFALIDPNNYFFGFAPRQIVGSQNLIKFPFLAIFPFFIAIFSMQFKRKDHILAGISIAFIFLLSFLENYERYDFVLWLPISAFIYNGFLKISKYKYSGWFFGVFIIFTLIEFVRIILSKISLT